MPLVVNARTIVRTIDSRSYGLNLAIWDGLLSGTATPALIAGLHTGVFRYPGGSASDDYDWQTDENSVNGTFHRPITRRPSPKPPRQRPRRNPSSR